MLVLKSQSIGFRISTTYLSLTYTESDGVNIKVDALELISTEKDYVQIELVFTTCLLYTSDAADERPRV